MRIPHEADSSERKGGRVQILACLLLGPLGMATLDRKHFLLGLWGLVLFLGGSYFAWPVLMPGFLALGFLLSAYRAHDWIQGDADLYQGLFISGFKSHFDSLPFFLPLIFDLTLLILLEALLRQAWVNRQRGSLLAALLVACISTPILMLGARAVGRSLIRRALRPFRIDAEMF